MMAYRQGERDEAQEIRRELEATHLAFHRLLAHIPEEAWEAPTDNPAWNVRQTMEHCVMAVDLLPQDVMLIRNGLFVTPPASLFDVFNRFYTRWRARKATPDTVARKYDAAHQKILQLLAGLSPGELQLAADYPRLNDRIFGGRTTIAGLYHYLPLHFSEHAIDVLAAIQRWEEKPPLRQVGAAEPPRGLKRLLFRLPLWLYRLELGWVLGGRFLLLNHIGRKSGRPHQTVLEVADHDPISDVYSVASGWGEKSDWYRNLRAHPQVTIRVGGRKLAVTAELLSPEASAEAMVSYGRRYPKVAPTLARVMGYEVEPSERGYRALGREIIRFVRLHPRPADFPADPADIASSGDSDNTN